MKNEIYDSMLSRYDLKTEQNKWKTRARVTPRAEEALTPDNFYN